MITPRVPAEVGLVGYGSIALRDMDALWIKLWSEVRGR